ncbi:MAG: AbrB/MazE/SpoVT family DNA-binding domain-containing protein [Candidatus Bathyarchaeia archaeon]
MVKRSLKTYMSQEETAIIKVQRRPTGSFMVTIPIEVIRAFDIKEGDKVKVLIERERRRVIYEIMRKT